MTVNTQVWIDSETAEIALTELQARNKPADTETTLGDIDQAIDDLHGALTTPPPRTQLSRRGTFEEIQIPDVPTGTVAIDYYDDPTLLVHTSDEEEPTHSIALPTTQPTEPSTGQRAGTSSPEQSADELPPVSTLIAQWRAGERDLIADATVSAPDPQLIELRYEASDGTVIVQYDYARAYRTDTNEMFELLL